MAYVAEDQRPDSRVDSAADPHGLRRLRKGFSKVTELLDHLHAHAAI
ncbi:hypothetical protein [Verrucosispora sioxanthis]|uniref:Uncharacterized protein n=1 Tax=Verrucosispora sioxanthis TaxID=2499994 RepID=A0A6M1L732_9ACTN|nr:hypothetical protein [Verrucosispora sioxanthis]NEE63273.1 hypothetical protein [Verrucosispora sioxanthis]NGM12383.1 hypothetical protein [Verrucosispora sioxanthis]